MRESKKKRNERKLKHAKKEGKTPFFFIHFFGADTRAKSTGGDGVSVRRTEIKDILQFFFCWFCCCSARTSFSFKIATNS